MNFSAAAFLVLTIILHRSNQFPDFHHNKIDDENDKRTFYAYQKSPSKSSNLGCFICSQLLAVTRHRMDLSQPQLGIVLNEKCQKLPTGFHIQCFAFVSESLPLIYVSLTYNTPVQNICQNLEFCDTENPFIKEETYESTTIFPPQRIINELGELSTSSPFEKNHQVFPPSTSIGVKLETKKSQETTFKPDLIVSKIPDFKDLSERAGTDVRGLSASSSAADDAKSKRLTCLFCERMLENAKNYAITSRFEITAFANATCARLSEANLAESCFQLTDRKITELAVFVDGQVVEALWCAQVYRC